MEDTVNIADLGPENLRVLVSSANFGIQAAAALRYALNSGLTLPTKEQVQACGQFGVGCMYFLPYDEAGMHVTTDWNPRVNELEGIIVCCKVIPQILAHPEISKMMGAGQHPDEEWALDTLNDALRIADGILSDHYNSMRVEVPDTLPEGW